jgi:hypothetical protein
VIWDYAPVRGNTNHCPSQPGSAGYKLQASGPGGTAQAQQYVNLVQ